MDYSAVVSDIMNRRRFGNRPGVEVSRELLKKLGFPERKLRIIHVAGTNGKGSVATNIAGILTSTGHRTGLFTSPHLVDFRERIRVDKEEISEDEVIELYEQIDALGGSPTMFDISFIMAILYFVKKKCEFAVLETGLGGRLDSTSAISISPEVCVITSIGKDHTEVLGDTIEKIAAEKAGIIKPGSNVVIGPVPEKAGEVIRDFCDRIGAGMVFEAKTRISDPVFIKNLETVGRAVRLAGVSSEDFANRSSDEESFFIPGRFQFLKMDEDRMLLLDGAHNPPAAKDLMRSLNRLYGERGCSILIGGLQGHDISGVIKKLAPVAKRMFTVTLDDARAYTAEALCEMAEAAGVAAEPCETLKEAMDRVILDAKENKRGAVACGSFYLVGEIFNEVHYAP